jgi:hypothetical protein
MGYTNKVCHLLYGTKHVAKTAIFYHYENEWSSRFENAMTIEQVAVPLYDAHIDFDFVPHDYLGAEKIIDGKLCLGDEQFDCLVIPYADHISIDVAKTLDEMRARGLKIIFVNDLPENYNSCDEVIALDRLADELTARGLGDVIFEEGYSKVRVYHCQRDGKDIFMFANEERRAIDTKVILPCNGEFARIDFANNEIFKDNTENGEISLALEPSQSLIIAFGDSSELEYAPKLTETVELNPEYELELASYEDMTAFESVGHYDSFFNVTGRDFKPDFCGKMRYKFNVDVEKKGKRVLLDLGRVGTNARLTVNGIDLGVRFSAPYSFDVTNAISNGENEIEVTVGNTLTQKIRDRFSFNMLVAPAGLLGDMKIKYYK